jgi:hypothetical protein
MKSKKHPDESAARAGIKAAIEEAVGLPPAKAARRGPEPERLKIRGDWKAAVSRALRTPRPPGGWPK